MARVPAEAETHRRTRGLPVIAAMAEVAPKDRGEVVTFQAEAVHQEVVVRPEVPSLQAAVRRMGAEAGMMGDFHPVIAGGAVTGAAILTVQEVHPARDRRVIGNDALAMEGA